MKCRLGYSERARQKERVRERAREKEKQSKKKNMEREPTRVNVKFDHPDEATYRRERVWIWGAILLIC